MLELSLKLTAGQVLDECRRRGQSFEASANWPGAPAAIIGTLGYQAVRARWS